MFKGCALIENSAIVKPPRGEPRGILKRMGELAIATRLRPAGYAVVACAIHPRAPVYAGSLPEAGKSALLRQATGHSGEGE